jgi:hypothetical protein
MGSDLIEKKQFWMPSMSILVNTLSNIPSLDVLDMDSLGHHILMISTSMITFYGGIKKCVQKAPHR